MAVIIPETSANKPDGDIHSNPEFQRKRRSYLQDFILRHLSLARNYRKSGLINEEGSRKYRNIVKHQLLSAVMTETVSELLEIPRDKIEWLVGLSLTHDIDKRKQQEKLSKEQIINDELSKNERPLVATSTNFIGFRDWGIDEYILRYVDSSVGENPSQNNADHSFGTRDPNNLPEVIILPWRQRIQMFKKYKGEEGEKGISLYGVSTWDKLKEIMTTIEKDLFQRIIEKNPELAERYNNSYQLTELVENKIHEKILSYIP